jgi:hypothetical protein
MLHCRHEFKIVTQKKNCIKTVRPVIPERHLRALTILCGFSPQANYTDRATAACRRSYCQILRIEGVTSAQRVPTAVNLDFLDPEPLLFRPNSSVILTRLSRPRSRLTISQKKTGSAGNRTWDLWICSHELWPLDHKGGPRFTKLMLKHSYPLHRT